MHHRMGPALGSQQFAAHFRRNAHGALEARRKTSSRAGFGALGLLCTGLMALSGCALLNKTEQVSMVEPAAASHGGGGAQGFMLAPGSNTGGSGASDSMNGTTDATSTAGATGMTGTAGTTGAAACDSLAGLGECGNTTIAADIRTVNILLVIDKSGSMTDEPQGFEVNKWSAIKTALAQALSSVSGDVNLGLLMFPYSTTQEIPLLCHSGCCEVSDGATAINVDIDAGDRALPTILNALDATNPGGGTPTAAALARANDYFKTGVGSTLPGNNYVLLATDGGPNCNANNSCGADKCTTNLDQQCDSGNCCASSAEACLDDYAVTQQIQALKANGVRTFVVGIPGTENYSTYLNAFAQAGGETNPAAPPGYYAVSAMGGVQGLVDVFTGITTQLVHSCTLPLASDPPKLDEVNLAVDCQLLKPLADDGSSWTIDQTQEPYDVVLKGPICTKLQGSGARRVDIVYGCPTVR